MKMDTTTRSKGSAQYRTIKKWTIAYRRLRNKPLLRSVLASNKWVIIFFLVVIPLSYVTALLFERTHTNYYLFTGPRGGSSYLLGPRFADVLNKPDKLETLLRMNIVPDFIPQESCGSLDNIYYINQGIAHVGFAEDGLPLHFEKPPKCSLQLEQSDALKNRPQDGIRLRALMPLYRSPLHVVARKELGISDLREIQPHSKVYMGPEGGATAFVTELVLKHHGIVVDRIGKNLNFEQAMTQMIQGHIEVGFFLVPLHLDAMETLSQHPDLKLLTIGQAASVKFLYPYLEVITIPPSTYKSTSKEITTLGTKTILVTSTELGEQEVYEIATKLSHNLHDLIKDIPLNATKLTDSDPQKDLYYPLHEGALRFYSHNPPFFLDPHTLAGIGTYLSIMFAVYKVFSQSIRNYRMQRILHAVDRAVVASRRSKDYTQRYRLHARKLSHKALTLLRHQRINLEEFNRINEYIKGHS
jgi:TRAP transporter TAXI family solute receptor